VNAIVFSSYGSPDVLQQAQVELPAPGDGEVVVKVHAAGLNPLDWHLVRGSPYPLRFAVGWPRPRRPQRLGIDFAGTVHALGRSVASVKVGDAVFGGLPLAHRGSLAEFVSAPADAVLKKPDTLPVEQAAGVFVAGFTALKAMRDKAKVRPGQKVLIVGASGGVGSFAVQIAKALGAEVTGVQSTRNLELVRGLGADHVIDYTREDFTAGPARFDVVLDNICNRSMRHVCRVMTPRGIFIGNSGGPPEGGFLLKRTIQDLVTTPFITQKTKALINKPTRKDAEALAELAAAGRIRTAIDRCYPLSSTAEALRHLEGGHAQGKVIVSIS
jgi:NADPH:quinone reductase-like Zn-dependent oxidoreductase